VSSGALGFATHQVFPPIAATKQNETFHLEFNIFDEKQLVVYYVYKTKNMYTQLTITAKEQHDNKRSQASKDWPRTHATSSLPTEELSASLI
jgi:hypothetical protein